MSDDEFQIAISVVWAIAIAAALCFLLAGCVSMGPSDWPAEKHVMMARTCKLVCHPGGTRGYDSTAGECRCFQRKGER